MDKMLDDDDNEESEQFPTPTPYVLNTTRPQSNPNPIASQILSHSLENQLILEYSHQDKYPNKWRTQPCLFFQRYGFCRKGDDCNFSHEIPVSGKQFVSVDKLLEQNLANISLQLVLVEKVRIVIILMTLLSSKTANLIDLILIYCFPFF
ncbi:hypothetical protein EDI_000830 [Entamoeba dispar SAW760]|uniref:C3H1-type domain-containing protein n=1 Tax=Entamoeba dispar (strain ATCC PRA-260 / SAW760) TaxID=370354 RepID=B0EEJ8_ENTDS|nr:uncharacterized protein EDI_000830 [Entamoeba dispar SAW760]EDR27058.1 hypothetical protein EDI_000830 [Entamoeba dispar SAW760]|eukprot:EDR27058.1 hypothetical protein EDI_000830 [Entamoeba dispar SAW760]